MKSRVRSALAACVGCLLIATVVKAAPLGLNSKSPDVTSGFVKVLYTASSDTFTATGTAAAFDVNGIAPPDYSISSDHTTGRVFSINMTVNPSTGASTGGTISITGDINTAPKDSNPDVPAITATSGTLLTGTIASGTASFGFPTSGGTVFEFLFTVTGGDLASFYGGVGATAGSIVNEQSGETGDIPFTGSFTSNFQNTSNGVSIDGVSDTFVVPEPMSLGALLLALLGLSRVPVRVKNSRG
jgi:hypothetical protein